MWLGKDMFCCCGFKTDSGNKMAKHLSTSGCSTAYPDAETANKALRGGSSGGGGPTSLAPTAKPAGGDGDEITSYDPSEEMAKAYMKEDKGGAGRSEPEGPLTFLGLQQKKNEEREVDDATKEAENVDCEESKKDGDPKDSQDSNTRVGSVSGVNGSEGNRGDEETTSAVEDKEVADKATTETEVTESQETSRSREETEVGATAMDTSNTATKEPGEQGKGPAPPAASGPAELLPQADLVDEAEAVFSQELAPAAETSAQDAPQAGEAETTATTAEDTSASLATAAMETE